MKIQLSAYEKAFSALPEAVQAAEVCADLREELLIGVREGRQTRGENFSRTTLYLRASGERTGTVLTEKLDDDPYALMEKALEGAACSQAEGPEGYTTGENVCLVTGDDSAGAADLRKAACAMEQAAQSLPGIRCVTRCTVRKTTFARRVLNSMGLDRYQEHTGYLAILAVCGDRGEEQGPEGKAEQYVPCLEQLDCPALAKRALEQSRRLDGGGTLPQVRVPVGKYPAVLSGDVVRNIMITAWMAFTGERLQSGASPFASSNGQVGSPLLHIADDPQPREWSVDYTLDSQGTLCRKRRVVSGGRLTGALHTLRSARAGGQEPTGNAGRVAGLSGVTPVSAIAIPSCIYVEPGERTVESLLEQMGDGIYLTYSLDVFHSINIASGAFSIPCGGVVYRDGKAVGTADQLTIAGNLRELFENIAAVGDDLTLEEFMFYHNYSYGGPSLLVKELAFSSKAD